MSRKCDECRAEWLGRVRHLLRFDEAAEVRPDPNLATPLNLRADSVFLCTKSATLVSFTPSTASRVRGVV